MAWIRFLLSGLAMIGLAGMAGARTVELVEYGVLCDVTIAGQRNAPLTESGVVNLIEAGREMDVITAEVPARLGLSFGIRIGAAQGRDYPDARVVVTHPPLGPEAVTIQSWASPVTADAPGIGAFTFEHEYELVQGLWRFRIVAGEEILVDQSFEILGAQAVPAVQQACFAAQFTS